MKAFLNCIKSLDKAETDLNAAASMANMFMIDDYRATVIFEEDLNEVNHLLQGLETTLNRLRAKAQVMEHYSDKTNIE